MIEENDMMWYEGCIYDKDDKEGDGKDAVEGSG